MAVDFELLAQLRKAGVKQIEFTVNNEMRLVEFFDPRVIAEGEVARVVVRELAEGPQELLEQIRHVEQDENLPSHLRASVAERLRSKLIYGSSG